MSSRLLGRLAAAGPPLSALMLLAAAAGTPGYDPLARSLSRLARPGQPEALLAGAAFGLVALSLLALAVGLRSPLLGATGTGVALLTLLASDPGRPAVQALHRLVTATVFGCLAVAPLVVAPRLEPGYRRLSFALGVLALGLLLLALALLAGGLPVGIWERCFAAVTLGWAVLMGARLSRNAARTPARASG